MKPTITRLLLCLSIAVALCAPAYAQEDVSKFPSKPITYIVPVTPGTGTDLSVRLIAKEAEKFLKQVPLPWGLRQSPRQNRTDTPSASAADHLSF